MSFKRKFAILAVPALLVLAGGAVAVHAGTTPKPTPAASQSEIGTENQAGEVEKANETGAVEQADQAGDQGQSSQSGHSDSGDQVDHQSTGNE